MVESMPDMQCIDVGGFYRGSTTFKQEQPIIWVTLSPFWIDTYPVTNQRYAGFIDAGGYKSPELWSDAGWQFICKQRIAEPLYWSDALWNAPLQPVTGVSWWEALAFARFEGKTLPTEAQWEAAAGGGERTYPWGETEPEERHATFAPECEPSELNRKSTPVDALPDGRSPFGCFDMAGNLGEWCLDNASDNYQWADKGSNPIYRVEEAAPHIVRGGSGLHDMDNLRCASRDYYPPQLRDNIVGIRCVSTDTGA